MDGLLGLIACTAFFLPQSACAKHLNVTCSEAALLLFLNTFCQCVSAMLGKLMSASLWFCTGLSFVLTCALTNAGVDVVGVAYQAWAAWVGEAAEVACWVVEATAWAVLGLVTAAIDMALQASPAMSAVCLTDSSGRVPSGNNRIPTCSPSASSPQGGWTTGGSSLCQP